MTEDRYELLKKFILKRRKDKDLEVINEDDDIKIRLGQGAVRELISLEDKIKEIENPVVDEDVKEN